MDIGWMKDGYRMTEAGVGEKYPVLPCLPCCKTGRELGFGG